MDRWTDRLSEYLDDALEAVEREALEAHLRECGECARTLQELRQVVARAHSLEDRPPGTDLWPAIAARIGAGGVIGSAARPGRRGLARRRFSFSLPELAAAGIVLIVLSGGTVWWLRSGPGAPGARGPMAGDTTRAPDVAWATFGGPRYDAAVSELERALAERRDRLDTATVRILEENLRTIDRAIEQGRRALAADPNDPYLNGHLAETMRRKLELLRRATVIASAAS